MRLLLVLSLSLFCLSQGANAAKIQLIKTENIDGIPKHHVYLQGDIVKGDYKRLRAKLPNAPYTGIGSYAVLHLNSRGGSYAEALRIAKYMLDGAIGTIIDSGTECYSACAIIFMAGNYFGGNARITNLDRTLHINGKLGFHAPFLRVKQGDYNKETVEEVHKTAIKAINKFIRLSNSLKRYGVTVVKSGLLSEMLERGPNEFFLIDTVDNAARFDIALSGYKKITRITRAMFNQICDNALAWKDEQSSLDFDHTSEGAIDGIQSIKEKILYDEYPKLEGFPSDQYQTNKKAFRVTVKFGFGVNYYCNIDVDGDLNLLAVDTYKSTIPSGLNFPGNNHSMPIWAFYPPETKIKNLGNMAQ